MNDLKPAQVLFIHSRLVSKFGGGHGLRDLGLLESAVASPQVTFDGKELYPDLFTKAAVLMDTLINNHPFVDGNKRTGVTATGLFLLINGRKLIASTKALEDCTLSVAMKGIDIVALAVWLHDNTIPI
jgi:death-on-curing protein